MSPRRVRALHLWAALASVVLSLAVLVAVAPAQQRPIPKGAKAGQYFKNVQVLKDLPAEQLLPTMRTFAGSLGVQCGFCHAMGPGGGFEKDTKEEKRIARRMIVMVRDLNQREKVIDHKATCYMCHHGQEQPETVAPAEGGRPGGGRGERGRERGDDDRREREGGRGERD